MNTQLMPVPFYEDTVVLVGQNNEPYVAMKPVVVNMGLDWESQLRKLGEKFSATTVEMTVVAGDGKLRGMICLPLKKLPAWLYSINPNKVKPELRDKIIRYQEECDDALWDYWTKGSATRAGAPSTTQRIALSRHRLALLKELYRTRDRAMREAIHQQLADASNALGLPTPELDSIGQAAPDTADVLTGFWAALAFLDGKGVAYNHSRKPELLAISLVHVQGLLKLHHHPLIISATLRKALRESKAPRYLRHAAVNSIIDDRTVRCAVFEYVTA